MSVINLADYPTCLECGRRIAKTDHIDGAEVSTCRCGMTTIYYPDIDYRVLTQEPERFTVAEWREIAIKRVSFTSSRWKHLQMAWKYVKMFIRGR